MHRTIFSGAIIALSAARLWAQGGAQMIHAIHQQPDQDGVYYTGPEVTAPKLARTVLIPYPYDVSDREVQGMTVLAMVIQANGIPAHIQILRTHGDELDQAVVAAVKQSVFEPGKLGGKPVPVWIDVRVVFHSNRSQAVPQVLIAERDLAPPDESKLTDRHHHPLSYTPPYPIHTVDADFEDPFSRHPLVQVAVVNVLVNDEGEPKEVRVQRGLGFGLDQKAEAAVWRYRFLPATKRGKPIEAREDIMVNFEVF